MLFRNFDFIAINYNQHQLKQQRGLCLVRPLLCALFSSSCFILFNSPYSAHRFSLQLVLVKFMQPVFVYFPARILEVVVKRQRFCMHFCAVYLKFQEPGAPSVMGPARTQRCWSHPPAQIQSERTWLVNLCTLGNWAPYLEVLENNYILYWGLHQTSDLKRC